MIIDFVSLLRSFTPSERAAQRLARRWQAAAQRDPELVRDVIRMGGILAQRPRVYEDGEQVPAPVDPLALAEENGRRELALEFLTLMKIDPYTLSQLLEDNTDVRD